MTKRWINAQVIWDTDSDPNNPGYVVKVDEADDEGHLNPITYAPHPDYYHAERGADTAAILIATAKWEHAQIDTGR